jgi:HK97 family phage major capsid protein
MSTQKFRLGEKAPSRVDDPLRFVDGWTALAGCDAAEDRGAQIHTESFTMANLTDIKRERAEAQKALQSFSPSGIAALDSVTLEAAQSAVPGLSEKIAVIESRNTLAAQCGPRGFFPAAGQMPNELRFASPLRSAEARNPDYAMALHSFLMTGGKAHGEELTAGADGAGGYHIPGSESYTRQRRANGSLAPSAATYEGSEGSSDASGGYAISVPTWDQIVPLAMPDLGIFDASLVIPTDTDIKIPQAAAFGTSVLKSESTGTIATFGGTDPTLGQVALTAFMAGALRLSSWELLQDVKMFQTFLVDDLIKGQRILEGSLLATGTGSGEPLGVFGNTGTGTGFAYALTGAVTDGSLLLESLFDVTATLKGQYQAGAGWIMSRATGLAIRRAQMQSNLFIPIATTDPDGTERILGKPVYYDLNAPALPTATSAGVVPILYGDFKQGYVIGVRGGAGINVKVLDQPWAAQGQLGILAYRRLDGRVRRSEAIQAITVSHT